MIVASNATLTLHTYLSVLFYKTYSCQIDSYFNNVRYDTLFSTSNFTLNCCST